MTLEERVKAVIGDLVMQLQMAQVQIEALQVENAQLRGEATPGAIKVEGNGKGLRNNPGGEARG